MNPYAEPLKRIAQKLEAYQNQTANCRLQLPDHVQIRLMALIVKYQLWEFSKRLSGTGE